MPSPSKKVGCFKVLSPSLPSPFLALHGSSWNLLAASSPSHRIASPDRKTHHVFAPHPCSTPCAIQRLKSSPCRNLANGDAPLLKQPPLRSNPKGAHGATQDQSLALDCLKSSAPQMQEFRRNHENQNELVQKKSCCSIALRKPYCRPHNKNHLKAYPGLESEFQGYSINVQGYQVRNSLGKASIK